MTQREKRERTLTVTIDQISPNAQDIELASLVTDDGATLVVPFELLPPGARVGDVMTLRFRREAGETRARKQRVADLQKKLFGSGFEP